MEVFNYVSVGDIIMASALRLPSIKRNTLSVFSCSLYSREKSIPTAQNVYWNDRSHRSRFLARLRDYGNETTLALNTWDV